MAIGAIGKYERLDVLGHGTSGVVYLAWDTLLRRQVALKEIRAAGPDLERVLDEARVLDRLRHPHIVPVNGVDRAEGAVLIDMELVRGRNLADVLRERGPLSPAEASRTTLAVLDALSFAHERRILHRDVKPANILIGDDGVTVKLTDFGLAEALGSVSLAGGGGTYPYMAPEDFSENAASDYRSDLWAVGVVLYEMLTGHRPFAVKERVRDPFAWRRAIAGEKPPRVSQVRPEVGTAFDAVLERALAKEKKDRYPNAHAFADALRAAAATASATFGTATSVAAAAPAPGQKAINGMATAPVAGVNGGPEDVFYFAGGTVAVDNLDDLLRACARHWDEARRALLEGRIERFLRAIGEVYIAELAADLASRTTESADRRLREFLDRSRVEEEAGANGSSASVKAEETATVPFVRRVMTRSGTLARRPRRIFVRPRSGEESGQGGAPAPHWTMPFFPSAAGAAAALAPAASAPAPAAAGAAQERKGLAPGWWFWPLFALCLLPVGATAGGGGSAARFGGASPFLTACVVSGVLSAMLLLVAAGAKLPKAVRVLCLLPLAGGAMAAAAQTRQALGHSPTPDDLVRLSAAALLPLAALLMEAATVTRLWRLWAAIVFVAALLTTARFANIW